MNASMHARTHTNSHLTVPLNRHTLGLGALEMFVTDCYGSNAGYLLADLNVNAANIM